MSTADLICRTSKLHNGVGGGSELATKTKASLKLHHEALIRRLFLVRDDDPLVMVPFLASHASALRVLCGSQVDILEIARFRAFQKRFV